MVSPAPAAFPPDYPTARHRFREAASRVGWRLEALPIGLVSPEGEDLTIDIARSPGSDPTRSLVVSSGVHGVEGAFGSAVQVAQLEQWASMQPPTVHCVFLHALNPYGFAHLRRFNEENVDPNRNFLLPGEHYRGSPEAYGRLDSFLNPRRPPSTSDLFTLRALWLIARHGMPALRQAVAGGQYDYPKGLFFGGSGPSRLQRLLADHLPRLLAGSEHVVHLDFHTGLGRKATCKLLIDYPLSDRQRDLLTRWFGENSFEALDASKIAYDARGGLGRWCVNQGMATNYLFACAEFGTYGPIQVLAGLRAENQAHHWGSPGDSSTKRAKQRLAELFCPIDPTWRSRVIERGLDLIDRALRGLLASR